MPETKFAPMTELDIFISAAGRYGRCRISSSVRRLMSKGPSRPQCETFSPKPITPFCQDPLLDHKAKSRKQQQAQDNSLEGCFVDPSEQDDTDSRAGSQGGQSNAEVDQNL
jgi:hypothetical protein